MKTPPIFPALLVLTGFSAPLFAATVSYTFGTPGSETTVETGPAYAPTLVGTGLTATSILDTNNKVGLEISSAATTPPNAPFLRLDPQGNATDAATAVSIGTYFVFTISATAGNKLNSTSLEFDAERGGAGTPRGYVVRSSVDNFASNLAQADLATARPTYTHVAIPLSAAAFQNLSDITFRIYSYAPATGNSVDYDNIVYTANVVPEPATSGLLALAGAVVLSLTRPRKRRNAER